MTEKNKESETIPEEQEVVQETPSVTPAVSKPPRDEIDAEFDSLIELLDKVEKNKAHLEEVAMKRLRFKD